PVRARTATPAERERLWPRLVDLYADFGTYQAWTERDPGGDLLAPVRRGSRRVGLAPEVPDNGPGHDALRGEDARGRGAAGPVGPRRAGVRRPGDRPGDRARGARWHEGARARWRRRRRER